MTFAEEIATERKEPEFSFTNQKLLSLIRHLEQRISYLERKVG